MWDLQLLEQGIIGTARVKQLGPGKYPTAPPTSDQKEGFEESKLPAPFDALFPHKAIRVPNIGFAGPPYTMRHWSFSVGGEWCVGVGDDGMICILKWPAKEALLKKRP